MARKSKEHVYGPYQHRQRWRIVFVDGGGRRTPESFADEGKARAAAEALRARLEGKKVSDAIAEYLVDKTEGGARPSTIVTVDARLRTMFDCHRDRTGGMLAELTPARARALLAAIAVRTVTRKAWRGRTALSTVRPRSVDYRAGALVTTRTFMAWCVERGYLRRDPFKDLEVKGRRRKGKPQLHGTESRRFVDAAIAAAAEPGWHGDAALAALLALLLGARASEVALRQCRDVDLDGAVLWIPVSKTDAGRRRTGVPAFLQAMLHARAQRGAATDPLFPGVDRWRLLKVVRRICKAAGVPVVCTQSLRGLHGTLATEAGATAEMVARQLGHVGTAVTTGGAYIKPTATAGAQQQRVLGVILGGKK